ncbi:metal-dependent hydrolase [Jinshanibacter sp. LJY008]|uniref:Metal-dependent hydrolase n=1 Tax=Limnobaculum eriocheiris TaxID=2897391 RepID=A0A9X1MYR8_9GAMM|nr:metal-dependent hydrolase [Limnobaculum eriocheiris]MCD1126192.1 metal-dependent hydrolase [Limnobaculum eriocheiris]
MPTIVTHAAVPLCLGIGLGPRRIPPVLLMTGIAFSMIPDLDVLSFKLGIAYANVFGHRGFTHSLLFAFALPTLALLFKKTFKVGYRRIWGFLTVSLLSHSVLDSLTTGGMGVGWLWPWSGERFFAPVQVIKVAPFQLAQYLKPNGIAVIQSELLWVWLPGVVIMLALIALRRANNDAISSPSV